MRNTNNTWSRVNNDDCPLSVRTRIRMSIFKMKNGNFNDAFVFWWILEISTSQLKSLGKIYPIEFQRLFEIPITSLIRFQVNSLYRIWTYCREIFLLINRRQRRSRASGFFFRSMGVSDWALPSQLSVRKRRGAEETILSRKVFVDTVVDGMWRRGSLNSVSECYWCFRRENKHFLLSNISPNMTCFLTSLYDFPFNR